MDKQGLEVFNRRLRSEFGYFEDKQRFRLVWSNDQFEKRLTAYTDEGLELLVPEVRELPKYRQYAPDRYILESITVIPEGHEELSVEKISYEPIWTFRDKNGVYLEPNYMAAKFIINAILDPQMTYYKAPTNEEERQRRIAEIDELEELLYGNETKIGDALMRDAAVGYGVRNRNDGFIVPNKIGEN